MERIFLLLLGVAMMAFAGNAHAVLIDMTTVANPGNAADSTTYGAVSYTYNIGKYEVTNTQYAEFLNAVAATDTYELYYTSMGVDARGGITRSGSSGSYTYTVKANMGDKPVNFVTFYDTIRFVNWLNNGQPTGAQGVGTTETGAYTFTGSAPIAGFGPNWTYVATHTPTGTAAFWLPTEDEWYKAAYYDPLLNGGSGGYYRYPTHSNTAPSATTPTSSPNSANYNWAVGGLTDVGAYTGSGSHYGTYDQGGNVFEWNEAIILGTARGWRGSSWHYLSSAMLASDRSNLEPSYLGNFVGFRVAGLSGAPPSAVSAVPEPTTAMLWLVGGLVMWRYGSRRKQTVDTES